MSIFPFFTQSDYISFIHPNINSTQLTHTYRRFTGQVKLHTILIRSPPDSSAPRTLKVFINREDVDFDVAEEMRPTQTFELSQFNGVQELSVRRALFGNVRRLALFFEDNFGDDSTRISYLGFKGDWIPVGRAPVNILYESAPNPNDHRVKGTAAYRHLDAAFRRDG